MRRRAGLRSLGGALALVIGVSGAASAQKFPVYKESLPVATVNSTRLFSESLAGQAALKQSQEKSKALAEENRRIEAELEAEELELTELRKTMPAEEFNVLAEAFDEKVVEIRRVQNAKGTALNQELNDAQRAFSEAVRPVLSELMEEKGIVFILNEQAIVLADRSGDITGEALRRIDLKIGATLEPAK